MKQIYVAGNGNWGKKVKSFLEKADLFAGNIDIQSIKKPLPDALYQIIVWITYPPGERKFRLIIAALTKGFHVIIEKPIQMSPIEIQKIQKTILLTGKQLAVNFQYVFCNKVSQLAEEIRSYKKPVFEGNFFATPKNDLALEPRFNLASHILAIKKFWFPHLNLSNIKYGYGKNERFIRLIDGESSCFIDLNSCSCNLLEKFVTKFSESIKTGKTFDLSLNFALEVEGMEF